MSYIDVNKTIKKSIIIHSKNALIKNILISHRLQPELPLLYADEFYINQIIVELIAQALGYLPNKGNIIISTEFVESENNNFINIIIEDDSFGLSEQDLTRISKKFQANFIEDTNLATTSILELIKLHGGTCSIKSEWNKGRKVIINFPISSHRINHIPSTNYSSNENNLKIVK
jgi:signal transduction histidine kinase